MDLRLIAILAIFAGILAIGLFGESTQSRYIYIQHDHEVAVENIPHRYHPFVTQNNRFDVPAARPVALTLQVENGPSVVPITTVHSYPGSDGSQPDDTIAEWFSALASGFVSIVLGLMFLIATGVRFTEP